MEERTVGAVLHSLSENPCQLQETELKAPAFFE
jgi:hypothetical protein